MSLSEFLFSSHLRCPVCGAAVDRREAETALRAAKKMVCVNCAANLGVCHRENAEWLALAASAMAWPLFFFLVQPFALGSPTAYAVANALAGAVGAFVLFRKNLGLYL